MVRKTVEVADGVVVCGLLAKSRKEGPVAV